MRLRTGILALLPMALAGLSCTEPARPLTVTDPDPSVKIPAIKQAVADHDRSAARQLVRDLDSDDPAVRFFAIEGLRRLTGEDYGYRYYADRADRQVPLLKWQAWSVRQQLERPGSGGSRRDGQR